MNHGSNDFSKWQANARGVDLNHNYPTGFWKYKMLEKNGGIEGGAPTGYSGETPESEPEVGAISNFLRYNESIIDGVLTLHTQGEEIYFQSADRILPGAWSTAKNISEITGYRLGQADGTVPCGGLTEWCIEELGLPSFTLKCGTGPNPLSTKDFFTNYIRLRKLFFSFPTLLARRTLPME